VPLSQLLRLASFLLLLALGARVRRSRDPAARRRAVNLLLGYVLAVSGAVGVSQQDFWPFTCHQIAVGRPRADSRVCQTQFYGLEASGAEWRLDPWSWTPVYDSILQFWADEGLPRLDDEQRERALAFLLARAERSRARRAAGLPLGRERLLGPAGAPYWLLLPRQTRVPEHPYTALRIDAACWLPAEKLADPRRESRVTLAELRRP
jgi:hypothetical protein